MAKNIVKEIRKATRRKFSAEEKIRIVLEGLQQKERCKPLSRPSCPKCQPAYTTPNFVGP